jgi:hypothetical protein
MITEGDPRGLGGEAQQQVYRNVSDGKRPRQKSPGTCPAPRRMPLEGGQGSRVGRRWPPTALLRAVGTQPRPKMSPSRAHVSSLCLPGLAFGRLPGADAEDVLMRRWTGSWLPAGDTSSEILTPAAAAEGRCLDCLIVAGLTNPPRSGPPHLVVHAGPAAPCGRPRSSQPGRRGQVTPMAGSARPRSRAAGARGQGHWPYRVIGPGQTSLGESGQSHWPAASSRPHVPRVRAVPVMMAVTVPRRASGHDST